MGAIATTGACAGCGAPLPPNRNPGNPRKWCSERCRKRSYNQSCVDCGARTSHGGEHALAAEPRCDPCARARRIIWTRETLIEAIRRWARIYGEPPAEVDWNPWQAEHIRHDPARAERYYDDHWPSFTSVVDMFGSWNAGIEAAGFAPRPPVGTRASARRQRRSAAR